MVLTKRLLKIVFICLLSMPFTYGMTGDRNFIGKMPNGFLRENPTEEFNIKTEHTHLLENGTIIPKNATLDFEFIKAQKERRWHKGGYIICKLKGYSTEDNKYVDLSSDNYYLRILQYEPIVPKDAIILGTEIVLTQGAAVFAPGSDIGYYFIKGAIVREFHKNWVKAGVLHAYNYSVIWFWFHGKPIDIEENGLTEAKYISEMKAEDFVYISKKYENKASYKNGKKAVKKDLKETKKALKGHYKEIKNNKETTKTGLKEAKTNLKTTYKSLKLEAKAIRQVLKMDYKEYKNELKTAHKIEHKKLKNELKIEKKGKKISYKNLDKNQRKELKNNRKAKKKEIKKEVKALKKSYSSAILQERKENKLKRKEEKRKIKQEKKALKQEKKALKLQEKKALKEAKSKIRKNN